MRMFRTAGALRHPWFLRIGSGVIPEHWPMRASCPSAASGLRRLRFLRWRRAEVMERREGLREMQAGEVASSPPPCGQAGRRMFLVRG
jgi:hypothetical protein